MGFLITGIVLCILPILTWFLEPFVPALGATLFFWVIGAIMIIVGADRITPGGIWAVKNKPSSKPPKGHHMRTYQFDDNGKIVGQPTEQWVND